MSKIIATHDGVFHADEVCAIACLKIVYPDAEVIRSRDPESLSQADILVDVGREWNPHEEMFDHHQPGGAGQPRANGIPFASFGLVVSHYSRNILDALGVPPHHLVEVYQRLDKELISEIDAADCGYRARMIVGADANADDRWGYLIGWEGGAAHRDLQEKGVEVVDGTAISAHTMPREPAPVYGLSQIISSLNPSWDGDGDFERNFHSALQLARDILVSAVENIHATVRARAEIREALQVAWDVEDFGSVLILDQYIPWQQTVVQEAPEIQLVVFPDANGRGWVVQVVPQELGSFDPRVPLPKSWAGKSGEELARITGVADATFCHNGRFIAGCRSKSGALQLAERALLDNHPTAVA